MVELHKLENYSIETLKSLIDNKIEESINLEYKRGESLAKTPVKKKELAKDISAMANADGGIIIYGMEEIDHVPIGFKYVNGYDFTKESLDQIISTTIKRGISNIRIHPIRIDNDISKTVYVIQIPASDDAPHMNNLDKRFYVRKNFESVQMEEYEVRKAYNNRAKISLDFESFLFSVDSDTSESKEFQETMHFKFSIGIINTGSVMTNEYRVNAYLKKIIQCVVYFQDVGQSRNYSFTSNEESVKITNEKPPQIFPGENLDVLTFYIKIETKYLFEFFESYKITREILFQNEKIQVTGPKEEFRKELLDDISNKEGLFSFLNEWGV
ncbi:ATP-binding protein [Muricauda sp. CAU 1633]|uniref:AlbA family DNA-binding domain-containing protein n=1 Tax=Allomuricauda sp. CAU 1633 TaxID=2816036 RepID=UPI001A8DB262|nr:ATP-binding protein [Muricauda sp. CAU 1633]MBO0324303.1 ATP-binding protein [Muricauda sp. CAU 1633]